MFLFAKQTIQCSCLRQVLEGCLVHYRTIDSSAKVKKITIRTVDYPFMNNRLCRLLSAPFNST